MNGTRGLAQHDARQASTADGAPAARIRTSVRAEALRAIAQLERGLGDYGARR